MPKFSLRYFITSVLVLSCAQLFTGCLTNEKAVRNEAPIVAAPAVASTAYAGNGAGIAAQWRSTWDQNLSRSSGGDSVLGGSNSRDLEAGLWVQNDIHGTTVLSSLRSSNRGGNSFWAPSDSWGSPGISGFAGGSRFRSSFESSPIRSARSSSVVN